MEETHRIYLQVAHLLALVLVLSCFSESSARADAPTIIRVGKPAVGVGNRPAGAGNAVAAMHLRGMLEDELDKDGIQIT